MSVKAAISIMVCADNPKKWIATKYSQKTDDIPQH